MGDTQPKRVGRISCPPAAEVVSCVKAGLHPANNLCALLVSFLPSLLICWYLDCTGT